MQPSYNALNPSLNSPGVLDYIDSALYRNVQCVASSNCHGTSGTYWVRVAANLLPPELTANYYALPTMVDWDGDGDLDISGKWLLQNERCQGWQNKGAPCTGNAFNFTVVRIDSTINAQDSPRRPGSANAGTWPEPPAIAGDGRKNGGSWCDIDQDGDRLYHDRIYLPQ